jgi:predicted acetyltransferase
MQDLAPFRNSIIGEDGRYRDDRLRTYLAYEEHWPLVIRSNGEVAGFALVRKSKPDTHVIGEFFIKSEFRRTGVGAASVEQILQKFKGNWEIPFQNENPIAAIFWRKTIAKLGFSATESVSEFADDQKISSDCLLMFSI